MLTANLTLNHWCFLCSHLPNRWDVVFKTHKKLHHQVPLRDLERYLTVFFCQAVPWHSDATLDMWCSELVWAWYCEAPGRTHGLCYCFYTTGHGFPLEWSCRWDHSSFWPRFQLLSGGLQNNPSAASMTDRAGSFERLRIKPQRVIDKSSGTGGGRESEEEWEGNRE